jgi:uncharacterized caspase-like protein
MRRALREFSDHARGADIAAVFYAGHGIEVDGNNYLIPVDAVLERDIDVEDEALSLDRVVKIMEPVKRLRLIVLDACRDNPFTRSMKRTVAKRSIGRGLAQIEVTASNTLIAYAAKAGSIAADGDGANSPFTAALIRNLATPGLDIRLALGRVRDEVLKATGNRQEPFVYGSLGGAAVALVAPAPAPAAAPSAGADSAHDVSKVYEFAAQVGTKEAWDRFIATYSTGFYASLARAARQKLEAKEAEAAAAEQAARFKTAAETPANAKAAADAAAGAKALGEADARSKATEVEAKARAAAAEAEVRAKAAAEAEVKAKPAEQTPIVVAIATPADPVDARKPLDDPSKITQLLQTELQRLGCYSGTPDGKWDSQSRRALALFNRHAHAQLDVTVASLDALGVVRAKTTRVCPLECKRGFKPRGDACVRVACPRGQVLAGDGICRPGKEKAKSAAGPPTPSAIEAKQSTSSPGAQIYCGGGGGCRPVPKNCRVEQPGGTTSSRMFTELRCN